MMHTTEQTIANKQTIRNYFNSWLKKDFSELDSWFNQDVYYRECYGATYEGLNELKAYINSKSKEQTVLRWDISQIEQTTTGKFVVTWFFDAKEKQEYCFDGVSLIAFSDNKIKSIVEYSTKHETYRPYKDKV
ncbi:nuclear transport factor 2 family protein [uncultured Lactobacillus sp.]|uniref:nuclear transport factor 2 family protein n=1 Tax=uncultured Lactobacillus sp. TaxID=153152 RepID=UPI0025E6C77C|nr:nuclear transport factor 2 family protein [uncultured Lactobacillus sp.]